MSDRWLHIFREIREKHLDFQDFCNVVGFILCLPGSTAPDQRIFSVMSSMWTKEKSRLSVETMKAMLIVRQNNDMECDKLFFLFLFAMFILHSRESELYRYTLDANSALAWELPFSRFMGHLSST